MENDPKPTPEPSQKAPSDPPQSGIGGLRSELKRRHVVRVAITCAVIGKPIVKVALSNLNPPPYPTIVSKQLSFPSTRIF
jgi:hypothetical protein